MFDGLMFQFHRIESRRKTAATKFSRNSANTVSTAAAALQVVIPPSDMRYNSASPDGPDSTLPVDLRRDEIVAKINSDRLTFIQGDNG